MVAEGGGAAAYPDDPRPRPLLAVKRVMDVVLAVIGLVLLAPVIAVIAAGILLTSGRPILYPWRVVGLGGRPFVGYKFRTMVRNADDLRAGLAAHNVMNGPVFKMENDPRVTRAGRVLRKLSLDELPQLVSVIRGDMSLVGPRPAFPHEWERYEVWQRRRLSVRPGMTGLWQVSGRADLHDFYDWVRMDLEYIDRWSLWLDVRILLMTIPAVLRRRGAY